MSLPPLPPWVDPATAEVALSTPPAPPRRSLRWPVTLAIVTVGTTLVSGAFLSEGGMPALRLMLAGGPLNFLVGGARFVAAGFPYAFGVSSFFLAHEMGHYVACRVYGVDATLPFFIPAPPYPLFFGTFGAVIRIRSPIPSRRALFDIGIAGPLAGFAVAVPLVVFGVLHAEVQPPAPLTSMTHVFGDSLLTWGLVALLRPEATSMTLSVGPVFIAGWLALLATALNLVPAGQLDGGHIVYALTRRWHAPIALAAGAFLGALVVTRGLRYHELSGWLLWAMIVFLFGRRHPDPLEWDDSLGRGRVILAGVAGLVLLLSFMPNPLAIVP